MDKIYVNGSIVSESGRHYAADFAAGGSIQDDYNGEVIEGDLVLTAQNTIKPYFEYEATGDIVASGIDDGDIYVVVPPTIVLNQFEKDLDDVLMMTDVFLDNKVKQNLLYKMCYLNAVCAYEYFMGSFLVSVVLRDKYFFERYCSFFQKMLIRMIRIALLNILKKRITHRKMIFLRHILNCLKLSCLNFQLLEIA